MSLRHCEPTKNRVDTGVIAVSQDPESEGPSEGAGQGSELGGEHCVSVTGGGVSSHLATY